MFPLRDDNPTERRPWVTLAIVAACVLVWVVVQGAGTDPGLLARSVCGLGAIPAEITGAMRDFVPFAPDAPCALGGRTWSALVTSMFLHGSWLHLVGNLWFLWIFGNNVEDALGPGRFAVFYLLCGVVAAGAHVLAEPGSVVPMVGASGAISGVMGAYIVLYPRARVDTLVILVILIRVIPLPAWVVLGLWFLLQLGSAATDTAGADVAFWAHVGGFLVGVALIMPALGRRGRERHRARRAALPWPPEW